MPYVTISHSQIFNLGWSRIITVHSTKHCLSNMKLQLQQASVSVNPRYNYCCLTFFYERMFMYIASRWNSSWNVSFVLNDVLKQTLIRTVCEGLSTKQVIYKKLQNKRILKSISRLLCWIWPTHKVLRKKLAILKHVTICHEWKIRLVHWICLPQT